MFRSKIIPIEKIGELIPDDAVVTVSSSGGLGCPDAALRSIGKHFLETGKPRGITAIHPIAAGDMYGIPRGRSSHSPPRPFEKGHCRLFRKWAVQHAEPQDLANDLRLVSIIGRIHLKTLMTKGAMDDEDKANFAVCLNVMRDNQIQAYNVPSGILFHMHRELAAGRPGVLTKVGMDTFVDPRRLGAFDQALAARNKVILVREPSELGPLGDTARRSVAPESTTTWSTLAARELRPRDR
jgi:propionate CoA-transferase